MKAISAILLLLLKHLKVNHIYQFEYVGQHLVFANCIPLILKFFNQNVSQYVAGRNNFSTLNFPNCVFSPHDAELTNDIGERGCVPHTPTCTHTNSLCRGGPDAFQGNHTVKILSNCC